jgi:hypothetical protein
MIAAVSSVALDIGHSFSTGECAPTGTLRRDAVQACDPYPIRI